MKMSNKVYNWLKAIAEIVIPAIATVYWILSGILGLLPYGEQVVGALVAIDTCLGAILAYSSYEYEQDEASEDLLAEDEDPVGDDIGEAGVEIKEEVG